MYSRQSPSPRFQELARLYRQMHEQGDAVNNIPAEQTFQGISLPPQADVVRQLIQHFQAKSLLDYGCGKALAYGLAEFTLPDGSKQTGLRAFWGIDDITLYDPGYAPYSALPTGRYDVVISTDVLEHVCEEDLDWVIGEIFGYAKKAVYCTVACYPARKSLPNGENAHVTLQQPDWWKAVFRRVAERHPGIPYYVTFMLDSATRDFFKGEPA